MAANWTAFDFKRALATAVAARAAVVAFDPAVRVVTYFPSPEDQSGDLVILGYSSFDSEDHQRAHAGGPRFDETVDVISQIRVLRLGAGQTVADAAEDRAEAILAEIDDEVRDNLPTVGNQSWAGKILDRESSLFAWNTSEGVGSIVCLIEFVVQYKARTS